ncbi:MAG: hypothetical protein K2F77_02745 [Muribaculaceae bacterium]|nr:hypothetical protein [Muribaculaceae bacterium]
MTVAGVAVTAFDIYYKLKGVDISWLLIGLSVLIDIGCLKSFIGYHRAMKAKA